MRMFNLSQDNISLTLILEFVEPIGDHGKQLLCITNTHIHANPEHTDVKLWQVHTLLKGLEKIAARYALQNTVYVTECCRGLEEIVPQRCCDHCFLAHNPHEILLSQYPTFVDSFHGQSLMDRVCISVLHIVSTSTLTCPVFFVINHTKSKNFSSVKCTSITWHSLPPILMFDFLGQCRDTDNYGWRLQQ